MANGGKRIADNGKKVLTDKEIIKALECCIKPTSDCDNCPLYVKGDGDCVTVVKQGALDLINQQHEKIEYMQGEREALLEDIKISSNQVIEQQAEIEKLTINMNAFGLGMKREKERADNIRAEAIKEFAKKLKDLSSESDLYDRNERWVQAVTIEEIDETYKEMVGDDNAE